MWSENSGYHRTRHALRAKGGKGVCPGGRGGCKGGVLRAGTRGHTCCAVPLPGRWSWRMDALPARRGGRMKNSGEEASAIAFSAHFPGGRGS